MPWVPELFSAPVRARLEAERRENMVAVPFFAGLMTGEIDALVNSFAGEPEVHDPVRGRVRGARAFAAYVAETTAGLTERHVSVERVDHGIIERGGFEEVVLNLDGDGGRVGLPVAVAADRGAHGRIAEVRLYYSTWPLTGRHAHRPPLLQTDPELSEPDVVRVYQRALAAGDLDAVVATFEPDGYAREPAGADHVHAGPEDLRRFYAWLFSNDGGIPLEHCALIDDGHACALEYNVVRWGQTELSPEAGMAVYARGPNGGLAAARIYDDCDPPLAPPT